MMGHYASPKLHKLTTCHQWQPMQEKLVPWQGKHVALLRLSFPVECRSTNSRVWSTGFNVLPGRWHSSQLNGLSISLWHTKQSDILGKFASVTEFVSSSPRWQPWQALSWLSKRRTPRDSPKYRPSSRAARMTAVTFPSFKWNSWFKWKVLF